MAELKLGLAPNRTSYYDPITNTYITLSAPVQTVTYNEADIDGTVKRLEKIVHALFASVPALVLYEGKVPQECIDHWESKYTKMFRSPTARNIVVSKNVGGTTPIPDVLASPEVVGQVDYRDPLRDGVDNVGADIEPNRAYDRPEKVNAKSADNTAPEAPTEPTDPEPTEPVNPVSEGEAEEVTFQAASVEDEQVELLSEEAPVEEATEEPKAEKKTTSRKRSTASNKSEK